MTATTPQATVPATSTLPTEPSGFLIGPFADSLLIIGAPIVALVIAAPIFALPNSLFRVSLRATTHDLRQILIVTFINAHLFLVFFRSHVNENIFRTYHLRFTIVPLCLILLGAINRIALGVMGVIAVWWDVYHSSLQTFGFGRIYDAKQKNNPATGRRLDYWMNLLVYIGPILAGAHFIDHLNNSTECLQFLSSEESHLDELFLQQTPDFLQAHQTVVAIVIVSFGVPFLGFYLFSYYRLQQLGYRVSWQKVWLLVITSVVSIYCWGFRSFIDAFWVMNFFHALQYFAIVIFAEYKNISRVFRADRLVYGGALAAMWAVSVCLLYGLWSGYFATGDWSLSMITTVSLMHFWYDGFIWSVKKKQV